MLRLFSWKMLVLKVWNILKNHSYKHHQRVDPSDDPTISKISKGSKGHQWRPGSLSVCRSTTPRAPCRWWPCPVMAAGAPGRSAPPKPPGIRWCCRSGRDTSAWESGDKSRSSWRFDGDFMEILEMSWFHGGFMMIPCRFHDDFLQISWWRSKG